MLSERCETQKQQRNQTRVLTLLLRTKMGSSDIDLCNGVNGVVDHYNYKQYYGKTLKILPPNDQIKELQTILRDK